MPALASELRKTLENTVVDARDKAERGARDALTALAVAASEPYASMNEDERKLRNRLRARGRQLGDQRDPQKGTQSIERLVREMAYEHWHRMLFARFLAENQLLIEPSSGVAITLEECEELAAEEGTDLWGMAAQFAQKMLPQIFRTDDPVLALRLPLEIRQQLQGLVAGLAIETFTASDSLGWTYQFWQTKRKKEVNDSGVKIGADELSPVTQLFTEDYMVDFLLDNTLGAWHAGKKLAENPELASTAQTEDELRRAVALPGCPWSYLRFIKSDDGVWAPAAGTFEGWPRTAAELKCLDPCMGSGHFIVAMFERLVALRIAEEGLSDTAAVASAIEVNIWGLEIDPRCSQIAAFNLATAAWRHAGHCNLPAMNLACSGLAPNTKEANWLAIAGENERLTNGMQRLYNFFEKASVLGSLINPRHTKSDLLTADFDELQPLLEQAVIQDSQNAISHEMAVTAQGLTKAAEILASNFNLVATNPPFLKSGKQCQELNSYLNKSFKDASSDVATSFIQRCLELCALEGVTALVLPQNWLFLKAYRHLRARLLKETSWKWIARLGTRSFQTPMYDFNIMLGMFARCTPSNDAKFSAIDADSGANALEKSFLIQSGEICTESQLNQKNNPDQRIVIGDVSKFPLLSNYAKALSGLSAGDSVRFERVFWEVKSTGCDWEFLQGTVGSCIPHGGKSAIVFWEQEKGQMFQLAKSVKHLNHAAQNWLRGKPSWGKRGVAISQMNKLQATLYSGEKYDCNCCAIVPNDERILPALWAFCSSQEFHDSVRTIDQALKVTPHTLLKVPFDIEHWTKIADEKYPLGIPEPFSSNPTQWLFDGQPVGAEHPLHVAVARLVGYQWPRQTGTSFTDCPALEADAFETHADADGIVCINPIRGEAAAVDRLRNILSEAFADEWNHAKERELLLEIAIENGAKKTARNIGDWLQQNFFAEHCKLFQSRPFIWQVWDGNPHGFSALVNYHKLAAPNGEGRKTLELLTYSYLGDWIDRQTLDQAEGINGADDRLAAALVLQGQLKKILEGEPPYDIFVRWKPLHQQSIGWDPDINDGVRLNIRPFLSAQLRKGGKAGAGILRAKPGTIKWKKDRGKEPNGSQKDFPWFWGWDENSPALATDFGAPIPSAPPTGDSFDGNRWNDLHYTRAAKEAARARHRGEA